MDSDCTLDDSGIRELDCETGEMFQRVICLRSMDFCHEPFREPDKPRENSTRLRSTFRIPLQTQVRNNFPSSSIKEERIVDRTRNLSVILCMLPTILMFPAWASIMCAIGEASIHIWTHERNKAGQIVYRSPLNLISSEFCAKCRTEKWMQKIGNIQDKRSSRRNLVHPSVIKQVVR